MLVYLVIGILLILVIVIANKKRVHNRRSNYISNYLFPDNVLDKVKNTYPHLNAEDLLQVESALKQYFEVCRRAGKKMVSMPSQVVDEAWHQFILYTRDYKQFCDNGLGRFLHHVPAESMKRRTAAQRGIKRAWKICCDIENIDSRKPVQLPILFAIDHDLNIEDGFYYGLNCKNSDDKNQYCASHIGCGSCGGAGCGSSTASDGDGCSGSGCSSGCGGD